MATLQYTLSFAQPLRRHKARVHYVPVAADFSNLTDAVDWCEGVGNAGVCQRIGAAGRAYMEEHGFMDVEADLELGRAVAAAAVRERR